jgi:fatty-acyl-CoA synthase
VENILLDGLAERPQICSLQDIERIEVQPYQAAVPVDTMYALLQRSARQFGEQCAIVQLHSGAPEDPATRISYQALLDGVVQAANLFRALGVGEDDAVVLLLPSMVEAHFALWGAEIAGRACPVNYMLDTDHIVELVRSARAKVVVALGPDPDFDIWHKATDLAAKLADVRVLGVGTEGVVADNNFATLLCAQPTELAFQRELGPVSIAAYYHTGGTTGAPKLALHTHGNQVHTSWFAGLFYGLGSGDCVVNGFPLFHVAGAFVYGAACFCAGASILIPPRLGMRHKGFVANYWRFVEQYQVSYLAAVPTVMSALLQVPVHGANIATVKALYTGGSPLPTELANNFESAFGIPVRNILGMTESAGLVCIEPLAAPRHPLSCGLRLPYTQVFAVANSGSVAGTSAEVDISQRCAANVPGIIVIAGPHVSPGYSDARKNAGMFAPTGELISGDLGHVDETGRIALTGRSKDVIIRGAHNIDPSLIEEAFMRHPDVLACAAVGAPDAYAGELPVVFVSLRAHAQADADAILATVTPHIFERAAVPKRVTVLEALPTTAVGKIFKPALRLQAVQEAYQDALAGLHAWCAHTEVVAVQGHGGIHVNIVLRGTSKQDAAEAFVKQALASYVHAYTIQWQ